MVDEYVDNYTYNTEGELVSSNPIRTLKLRRVAKRFTGALLKVIINILRYCGLGNLTLPNF
jgi:hypothetical protein